MAENDVLVSNKAARKWHVETASEVKTLRLVPGAYHELSKEINNHIVFETALQFMGERLAGKGGAKATPFGQFDHKLVKYYKPRPLIKRRKFWLILLAILYLALGYIFAAARKQKRFLLTWPKLLLSK